MRQRTYQRHRAQAKAAEAITNFELGSGGDFLVYWDDGAALEVGRDFHDVDVGRAELVEDALPELGLHKALDILAGFPHIVGAVEAALGIDDEGFRAHAGHALVGHCPFSCELAHVVPVGVLRQREIRSHSEHHRSPSVRGLRAGGCSSALACGSLSCGWTQTRTDRSFGSAWTSARLTASAMPWLASVDSLPSTATASSASSLWP